MEVLGELSIRALDSVSDSSGWGSSVILLQGNVELYADSDIVVPVSYTSSRLSTPPGSFEMAVSGRTPYPKCLTDGLDRTDEGDWYYSLPSHSPLTEKARTSPLTTTTPGHDTTFRYPGNPSHGEYFDQPRTYHSALYRPDALHAQSLGFQSTGSRSMSSGTSGMGRRGKIRGMLDMRRTSSLTRVDEELGEVECEA